MNPTFGSFLKQLRKRAGMTQHDLAAATGYSRTLIGALEQNTRLPDIKVLSQSYLPALGLQDEPHLANQLLALAASARGERPLAALSFADEQGTEIARKAEEAIHDLPIAPTTLIGREPEVSHLCRRLTGHQGRLLTLVGPPGIGKTRLALAVAAQMQLHYRDGVYFIPLATVTDAETMATVMLTALGRSAVTSQPPNALLIAFLRHKTMLLVLDNLEQIRAAAPLIADLLAACPGLVLLTTSRERLHLRSEQQYKVPPLDVASAVELFVQRAQAVDSAFPRTLDYRPTIAAICEQLDRLPLAIELSVAQIEIFSLPQLLAALQAHPLDLLVDGAHDLQPEHHTLRRAIERSYGLLNVEEQTLFRALGLFTGGFALPEVVAVMSGRFENRHLPLDADAIPASIMTNLRALVNKSLVRSESTPSGALRFLLLETIREFALEQVRVNGEEALLRQRHYAAYLQLARTGDKHVRTREATSWLARLKPEQDNFRAAVQWAFQEKRYDLAAWLFFPLGYYWFLVGQRYVTVATIQQLLPQRHAFPPTLRLALLAVASAAVPPDQEMATVADYAGEMLALIDSCENQLLQAATWARIARNPTTVTQALALERAIALTRSADEAPCADSTFGAATDRNFLLATHLLQYANYQLTRGEVAQAIALATESLAINRRQGDNSMMSNCLALLGRTAFLQGDLAQAQHYLQEAIEIAIAFNYATPRCDIQPVLARVFLYQGDVGEAQRLLNDSIGFCFEQQEKFFLAQNYSYLTETAIATGSLTEAAQWLVQSLASYADPRQISPDDIERMQIAARLATAQQQYPHAATLFGLAEQAHTQIHHVIGGPMRTLADAALATVQAALEPAAFAEAFAAGRQMTLEEGITTQLASGL